MKAEPDLGQASAIRLRFVMPDADLAPYITTFYHLEVGEIGGGWLEDWLHPEWANLRIRDDSVLEAAVGSAPLTEVPRIVMAGPTSHCTRFRVRQGRSWGIGLLPLGWATLCGIDARAYCDRFSDVDSDPALGHLAAIADGLFGDTPDVMREAEHLQAGVRRLLAERTIGEDRIARVNAALVDPGVATVRQMAEHSAISPRTLERLSNRVFGFSPKLLLRRQRFLRSLARYMLDPSMNWVGSMDDNYYDQAQFVHDFQRFMTMSPREYSKLPHPILGAAVHARKAAAGEAVQVLHQPVRR